MPARLRLAVAFLVLGLTACGSDEPTEYSDASREAFLAACTDPETDSLLQQRICQCVYDEAEASIPFERFREINDELADLEEPGLPDDVLDVVAVCVIEEGDL